MNCAHCNAAARWVESHSQQLKFCSHACQAQFYKAIAMKRAKVDTASTPRLVLNMYKITPERAKSAGGLMLSDIFAEMAAANKATADKQSVYYAQGAKIRMEWINNWLQRFNGQIWTLELMTGGQTLDIPEQFKDQMRPDWSYDEELRLWTSRFDKLERVAYWCTLRDPVTNTAMIAMTVEYYPKLKRSRHMYVAKLLQRTVDVPNILLEFHSVIADRLGVDEIETNPVPFVRQLFLKDPRIEFVEGKDGSGNMLIQATPKFKGEWKSREELVEE